MGCTKRINAQPLLSGEVGTEGLVPTQNVFIVATGLNPSTTLTQFGRLVLQGRFDGDKFLELFVYGVCCQSLARIGETCFLRLGSISLREAGMFRPWRTQIVKPGETPVVFHVVRNLMALRALEGSRPFDWPLAPSARSMNRNADTIDDAKRDFPAALSTEGHALAA